MANHPSLVAGGSVANIAAVWDFIMKTVQLKGICHEERIQTVPVLQGADSRGSC